MAYLVIMQIASGLSWFFRIVTFVMVLYAFLSWFVRPDNAFYRLLARFCQPILAPFRPIAARLMELDVGVTYLEGIGAYTDKPKKVILCAMRKQIFPQARQIVREEDPGAFMIVTSATEIFGEGFKDHHQQQL